MNIRNSIGFGITFLLVIVVCISFIVSSVTNFDSGTKKYFNNDSIVLENELSDILNKQMDCDNIIDGIISNIKKYDMNDPLILKNPYKINPLSALIFFYTEDELEVDVYINDGYMSTVKSSKEHIIPIYGLENNRDNIVRVDFENGTTRTFAIKTELYNDYT
jgi:hypothetical protein